MSKQLKIKIPAAAAAAAAAAADGVRAPSSAEKQNIKTHEMAKEHVLKKKQQQQNVYPRLVWSIFLFIYFFLNIRPCFVPKGEKRQAQKNT